MPSGGKRAGAGRKKTELTPAVASTPDPAPVLAKWQVFVREYLIDLNATRAALAAGYSEKSAHVTACRWLKKAKVQAEIAKLQGERIKRLDLSADKVLQELSLMGFANMLDYISRAGTEAYVDLSKLTREQAAAIQEITSETYVDGYEGVGQDKTPIVVKRTKFKLSDKRGALELLGKHLKLWTDKVEQTGSDGKPLDVVKVILIGSEK